MTFFQVTRWRSMAGRAGMFFCILLMLAILDILVVQFRKPQYAFDMLPGTAVKVNGPMPARIQDKDELTAQADSAFIEVEIERIHTGYWLGGNLWNGEVRVGSGIEPGDYRFLVRPREVEPDETFPIFEIRVLADRAAYREQAKSVFKRHTGIAPWWFIVFSFPLAVLSFLGVFRMSQIRERLLLKNGLAEVFRLKRINEGYEIAFGLGTAHGVRDGSIVALLDDRGRPVGTLEVAKAFPNDSIATVYADCPVKPGYLVALKID